MKLNKNLSWSLLFVGLFLFSALYTVNEKERAILLRLGEIVEEQIAPGLHIKIPLYHTVKKFDGRILTLDAEPERYLTSEKKSVLVDSFATWRIDPNNIRNYYTATAGIEQQGARRLLDTLDKRLRDEFANRTIQEVVSGERGRIMDELVRSINAESKELGIQVIDVRVKQIDLPQEVSESVYARMKTARNKIARDLRSKGAEEAEIIRAEADRQRTVILAEAYKESETTRGEGDAKATQIYASAYNKNPDFYAFYRRLSAYRNALKDKQDLLVLQPDSDFFKFFKKSKK
ncbi:MAG: protease modulator HflC [Gammaproteobacteria bacterium]|nr:protease modulator HflC [Gammaproteobacteria bacterium]